MFARHACRCYAFHPSLMSPTRFQPRRCSPQPDVAALPPRCCRCSQHDFAVLAMFRHASLPMFAGVSSFTQPRATPPRRRHAQHSTRHFTPPLSPPRLPASESHARRTMREPPPTPRRFAISRSPVPRRHTAIADRDVARRASTPCRRLAQSLRAQSPPFMTPPLPVCRHPRRR